MKFELIETVAIQDPEEVLRVLEVHLQKVAGQVVRTEGQITAYGIGPSPRTVNQRDTTVFEGRHVDGSTVLTANVTYQASALLGNSPQDDIVRGKIENAIDEMRAELKVWKPWASPPPIGNEAGGDGQSQALSTETSYFTQPSRPFETATESWGRPSAPEPHTLEQGPESSLLETAANPPVVETTASLDRKPSVPPPAAITTAPVASADTLLNAVDQAPIEKNGVETAEPPKAIRVGRHSGIRTGGRAGSRSGIRKSTVRRASSTTTEALASEPKVVVAPLGDVPLRGLLMGQGLEEAPQVAAPRGRGWKVALGVFVVFGLAVGGTYAMRSQLPEAWQSQAGEWTSDLQRVGRKIIGAVPAPQPSPAATVEKAPKAEPVNPAIVPAPELAVRAESNIYLWVQDWAAALRSHDSSAQASYYADPVDKYLTQTAVTHDAILQDKKDSVVHRERLWTIKIERIFVERQTATEVRLRLVKHTIAQPDNGGVDEKLVKSRLRLERTGDTWKIIEEEDLN